MAMAAAQLASAAVARTAAVQLSGGDSSCGRGATWKPALPAIECAKHPQKKATAHHNKTRPKKHNPYDKNRRPTYYPPLGKAPPICAWDTGDPSLLPAHAGDDESIPLEADS